MKTNIHFWSHLAEFSLELEMSQRSFVEEIKTHIFYSRNDFFLKSCVCELMWKNAVEAGRP
jgi:hypothetical protein